MFVGMILLVSIDYFIYLILFLFYFLLTNFLFFINLISGLPDAKKILHEAVVLPILLPDYFQGFFLKNI